MSSLPVDFSFDSKTFLENLRADLANAQTSIDIEVYILAPDDVGHLFFETLKAAAARGVRVRLLIDGVGSLDWINKGLDKNCNEKNFELRVFHKFPGLKSLTSPSKALLNLGRMNRRNHRKIYMIDEKMAYLGSFNITKDTLDWKETAFKTTDPNTLSSLKGLMDYTWKGTKNLYHRIKVYNPPQIEKEIYRCTDLFTTQTLKLRKQNRNVFIDEMHKAQERVWLMTPYFNPNPRFLKALRNVARRGVDVRLVLPALSDIVFLSWMARMHYPKLMGAGVKVYEYKPSFLHSKISLMDNTAIAGSGNLNYRSFMRDLEINMVLKNPENISQIEKHFNEFVKDSTLVTKTAPFPIWQSAATEVLMNFKTWF